MRYKLSSRQPNLIGILQICLFFAKKKDFIETYEYIKHMRYIAFYKLKKNL